MPDDPIAAWAQASASVFYEGSAASLGEFSANSAGGEDISPCVLSPMRQLGASAGALR